MTLQVFGVPGLPEIVPGSDLAAMILTAAAEAGTPLADGDVVVDEVLSVIGEDGELHPVEEELTVIEAEEA
jgi:coenzyme F420-0:L-glutamate ligase/coenzyme F420-1:gamma-L-glutamate ligase